MKNILKFEEYYFETILSDLFSINESINFNDLTISKLKKFLKSLSKEKILNYLKIFLKKLSKISKKNRQRYIAYIFIFLTFIPISYINSNIKEPELIEIIEEIEMVQTASFLKAQDLVKTVEGGYSSDRGDTGNYVNTPYGKRFIGTNHGISAPVLADFLKKLPTKEDMMDLSYETALDIYKEKYWDSQNLSHFSNQSVANILYDGCVNQGIGAMKGILRKILSTNDIKVGNPFSIENIERLNYMDQQKLFNDIKQLRKERYESARTFKRHGRGWLKRLDDLKY